MSQLLIKNIKTLRGIHEGEQHLKKGEAMEKVSEISDAFLLIEDDIILDYGSMKEAPKVQPTVDASGRYVMPTWIDSHTHIVFAAPREDEFVMKIKGATYADIAAKGGGILNSAKKLQQATIEELYQSAARRLEEVISMGTGTIEIKSGYGLNTESELKMLRVIARLKKTYDIPIKASFLGAHAFPKDISREQYLHQIIEEMIPQVADEGLANYVDVFCEEGFFSVEETDRILQAGAQYGLRPKIHANQLNNSGGVQVGIKNKAVSVDHLEMIEEAEIEALLQSDTIPTVLPSCSYFINIPYAPARRMIDAGLGIVMATDYNPGSSPSGNVPFLLSLGCTKMKMTPNEVFNAVTYNAAYAVQMESKIGTITRGKLANVLITKEMPSFDYIPYAFGSNHIESVYIKGKQQIFDF